MRWFWKDSKSSSPELEAIQQLKEQNNTLEEQCTLLVEQVAKLSRLQYKTSKDIQGKVDGVYDTIVNRQEENDARKQQQIIEAEAKFEEIAHFLINWLDDLDLIGSHMNEDDSGAWGNLLNQWRTKILEQLENLGVLELQVLGESFDPLLAESIETISREEAGSHYKNAMIPYQVVGVSKRGFKKEKGELFRKAQVVTIKKEKFYNE